MSSKSPDINRMTLALRVARDGMGTTFPNPCVGAVVVASDPSQTILGVARTASGGRPHAETQAIDQAIAAHSADALRGGTIYVTLEPCAHQGQTPPCANAIVDAGLSHAVIGCLDPDPRVSGQGIAILNSGGVTTTMSDHAAEATWLHAGQSLRNRSNRPFVQLKMAVSSDGRIAPGDGAPVWVTGEQSRNRGHLMRAQADAIVVGRGTYEVDAPSLNCRLPGLEKHSPERFVLSSTHDDIDGWSVVKAAPDGDLKPFLEQLKASGHARLLVEGGPGLWTSFLNQALVDEVCLFKGAQELGSNGVPPLKNMQLSHLDDQALWQHITTQALGQDTLTVYRSRATLNVLNSEQR